MWLAANQQPVLHRVAALLWCDWLAASRDKGWQQIHTKGCRTLRLSNVIVSQKLAASVAADLSQLLQQRLILLLVDALWVFIWNTAKIKMEASHSHRAANKTQFSLVYGLRRPNRSHSLTDSNSCAYRIISAQFTYAVLPGRDNMQRAASRGNQRATLGFI